MNHLARNEGYEIIKVEQTQTYEEKDFVWKITNISSVINEGICDKSPFFYFKHNSWCFSFMLFIKRTGDRGLTCWCLKKRYRDEYSVEYNCGVQKVDGTVEHFGSGNFKQSEQFCILMNLPSFEERKSELTISDVLTITCTLNTPRSPQPNVLDRPNSKKLRNLYGLYHNFKDLFTNKESCDTTLIVKAKEFKVHKLVLMARSSVFSAMFHNDMSEKQTGIVTILDCDPKSFQGFLEYLYTSQVGDMSFSSAFHLYSTSDKYDVQDLKAFCVEYLTQSLTHENVCEVVIMAHKYDDSKLTSATQDFFNRNIGKIVYTTEWECLLRDNYRLANKLLKKMSSKIKVIN